MRRSYQGEKIVNWHRPLLPGALKVGFLKTRDAALPVDDDEPWWWWEDDNDRPEGGENNRWETIRATIQVGAFNPIPLADRLPARFGVAHEDDFGAPDASSLAERLASRFLRGCDEPALSAEDRGLLREIVCDLLGGDARALVMVAFFRAFWLRPLSAWRPARGDRDEIVLSLVDHLFCRYPVPRPLRSVWVDSEVEPGSKWFYWYLSVAQGARLGLFDALVIEEDRNVAWSRAPKVLAKHLGEVPDTMPIEVAVRYAEILRLGGSAVELHRLTPNDMLACDPTSLPERDRSFWEDTVRWLIAHRDALLDEECPDLLAWAVHSHTEAQGCRPFRWRGRSAAGARRAALAYQQERRRWWRSGGRHLSWERSGWDWQCTMGDATWALRELSSSAELRAESALMHHCVASYDELCAAGASAIFRLSQDGVATLTVEVERKTRFIVQARGRCNRAASAQEGAILERWRAAVLDPVGEG